MPIDDRSLTKEPRKIELVSVRDGHTKTFTDDGASITQDGAFPHGLRQHLLNSLRKEHAQGTKDGPRIRSWIPLKPIERGLTNRVEIDPALAAKSLDDTAGDTGKTYREVIEINKAKAAKAAKDEARLALAYAKSTLSLDPASLDALAELIANKEAAAKDKK